MKKAFTLIELTVVIVIIGILGTVSIEILQKTANTYLMQKELNKLSLKTDILLSIISNKLNTMVKNSVIGSHCDKNGNPNGDFKSVAQIKNNSYYNVLEWLSYSIYSKRGQWNKNQKKIQPGWSGFVDLNKTVNYNNDKYKITTPDSNFSIVQKIDGNWSKSWGVDGYENVLDNNLDILVFSGSDGMGDIDDINDSYGYYGTKATRIFAIKKLSDTDLNLTAIDESNSTTVYEGYFIINKAIGIVPVKDGSDYNLTLRMNYFPWKHQTYKNGNVYLLSTNVTKFNFKEENGILKIYLCITSSNIKLKDYNLTVCKEKVIF